LDLKDQNQPREAWLGVSSAVLEEKSPESRKIWEEDLKFSVMRASTSAISEIELSM
jgi:hypothetical protein